jgi:hypothetical protein
MEKFKYHKPELKRFGENFLLKAPKIITAEELEKADKKHSSFFLGSESRHEQPFRIFELFYDNGKAGFTITYLDKLPDNLTEEQKKLFNKKEVSQNNEKKIIFIYKYGDERLETTVPPTPPSSPKSGYLIEKPRELKEQNPQELTASETANLIKQKRVVFYTGAGISLAEGVWAMPELRENLGLKNITLKMVERMTSEEFSEFIKKTEGEFIQKVLTNPEEILNAWKSFHQSAFESPASPAHQALAQIALKKIQPF